MCLDSCNYWCHLRFRNGEFSSRKICLLSKSVLRQLRYAHGNIIRLLSLHKTFESKIIINSVLLAFRRSKRALFWPANWEIYLIQRNLENLEKLEKLWKRGLFYLYCSSSSETLYQTKKKISAIFEPLSPNFLEFRSVWK